MNNTQPNRSRFGIVLSGALLAAAAFAVPGMFKGQQTIKNVQNVQAEALTPMLSPSAPEATQVSTGTTFLQIQNKENSSGQVFVTFYKEDGSSIDLTSWLSGTNSFTNVVPANGVLSLDFNVIPATTLPSGSRGSSVVSAEVDVAVVARNAYSPNRAATGHVGQGNGSNFLILPQIIKGLYSQQDSAFSIQNTTNLTASVTITYYSAGNAAPVSIMNASIAPMGSKYYDLATDVAFSAFPNTPPHIGFLGSAIVSSSQPVVAEVGTRYNANGMGGTDQTKMTLYNYIGFSSGQSSWYVPLVRRNYGATTAVQVANSSNITANVNINFIGSALYGFAGIGGNVSLSIPGYSAINYYQGDPNSPPSPIMSDPWIGSAIVTSDQPVVTIFNELIVSNFGARVSNVAHNAFSPLDGAATLYIPMMEWDRGTEQWRSGIQLQNFDSVTRTVRVDYVAGNGSPTLSSNQSWDQAEIPPLGSVTFYAQYRKDNTTLLPVGFFGSAKITAIVGLNNFTPVSGAKLAGSINHSSFTTISANNYDSFAFEAIK